MIDAGYAIQAGSGDLRRLLRESETTPSEPCRKKNKRSASARLPCRSCHTHPETEGKKRDGSIGSMARPIGSAPRLQEEKKNPARTKRHPACLGSRSSSIHQPISAPATGLLDISRLRARPPPTRRRSASSCPRQGSAGDSSRPGAPRGWPEGGKKKIGKKKKKKPTPCPRAPVVMFLFLLLSWFVDWRTGPLLFSLVVGGQFTSVGDARCCEKHVKSIGGVSLAAASSDSWRRIARPAPCG